MSRRLAVIRIIFFCFSFTCISCNAPQSLKAGIFFVLTADGNFIHTAGLSSLSPDSLKPWPSQTRVTDICAYRSRLFVAVNGCGIAELIGIPDSAAPRLLYSEQYFKGRTTTVLIPFRENLYCHVYSDTAFPSESRGNPGRTRISFVKINIEKKDSDFTPFTSRFQQGNAAWDAVMIWPLDDKTLSVQWKAARKDQSEFMYSWMNLENGEEALRDKAWFLRSCSLSSLDAVDTDPALRMLIKTIGEELEREVKDVAVLFAVCDPATHVRSRIIYSTSAPETTGATVYYYIHAVKTADGFLGLLSDGRLVSAFFDKSKGVRRNQLPRLPEGYQYTGIVETETALLASWEQTDFYQVGKAGIFFQAK
jgi:hypothetical protein